LEAILGAGGFGIACRCQDTYLRRAVVIKTLHEDDLAADLGQIFREGQILSTLRHPDIVQVYEAGYADPKGQRRPYLVMEYLEGYQGLDQYLQTQGLLPVEVLTALARRLANALAAAHRAKVLHRDIKPANLLVRPTRDGLALKVIDFGLALKQQAVAASMVAGNGGKSLWGQAAVGTWEYAAPEQMGRRPEPVGPYSDVNGFGKTLCRALLGKTSPDLEDYQRFGFEHPLILLLNRCLKDDPTRRPQSFEEVLQGLGAAQARQTKPSPPPRAHSERERAQRREVPERSRVLTPQDIHGWDTSKVQALQRQVAEAFGKPVLFHDRLKDSGEGPELVIIPPGRFRMGWPNGEPERSDNEGPQHAVTLTKPFALGRYAVTVGEFRRFVTARGYKSEAEKGGGAYGWIGGEWKKDKRFHWQTPGFEQGESHPAVCVSWNDAIAYCQWLSEQAGAEYRLPSEAEWEYACRAGTTTPSWWGDTITPKQANYNGNLYPYNQGEKGEYRKKTVPVDQFEPNPWGLYQMHGNVWEWVQDGYADDKGEAQTDPIYAQGGSHRVYRGGSWVILARYLRAACRDRYEPARRHHNLGFRPARTL
jgi:formylglycine-generating enzyme required for sulfatase activity